MRVQSFRGVVFALLLAVTAGSFLNNSLALALPRYPEPIDIDPDPFVASPNGFEWNAQRRFGARRADGMVDFHWDEATHTYASDYVRPNSFAVQFDGCATAADEAAAGNQANDNTYTWTLSGATSAPPPNHTCQFTATYPAQGAYTVSLAVAHAGASVSYTRQVVVKDWLIVSIGDSYASGESNPDIPLDFMHNIPARWEDTRCHRSALAGPAQAAMALESADPYSSVTYISLACSGAAITRTSFVDDDVTRPQGSGILGPYRGIQPPPGVGYSGEQWLPSQIDALAEAVGDRPIDVLIISAGGNDIGFGPVGATCIVNAHCPDALVHFDFDPTFDDWRSLSSVITYETAHQAGRYDALAAAINNPSPVGRSAINAAHVFLSEYPDPTRNDDGTICPKILDDILVWPFDMSAAEQSWAIGAVFGPLNDSVRHAAENHHSNAGESWHFVGGIADKFAGDGFGHGYCASDNWIRTASQSVVNQGPFVPGEGIRQFARFTTGTLHPTAQGHAIYRNQLVAAIRPFLPSPVPAPAGLLPPAFNASVTGTRGADGWLTTSGGVLTVTATAGANNVRIGGASVTVDGTAGCSLSGATCTTHLTNATLTAPGQ
jgi:hypothetical protein